MVMGPKKQEALSQISSPENFGKGKTTVKKTNLKTIQTNQPKVGKKSLRKKHLVKFIKKELNYVSKLFDVLDVNSLNHGRRSDGDDDGCEGLSVLDIPEKKTFKKAAVKNGSAQSTSKSKPFPQTIVGLEKELEELKGTSMTYQKKLRKKGLQSRLTKKKRKEELRKRKLLMKQGKNLNTLSGPSKLIKPVLNSDGNEVSNKFDFADNEFKKENKRKSVTVANETNHVNKTIRNLVQGKKKNSSHESNADTDRKSIDDSSKKPKNQFEFTSNGSLSETVLSGDSAKSIIKYNVQKPINNFDRNKVKEEGFDPENGKVENDKQLISRQGPIFNKDNKMVFSKVFIPELNIKPKKKSNKDPQKILQKIKQDSVKILELGKKDKEKAESLKEKQKWMAALKRASGEKIKDDTELLKKTISKEKNKKVRSQKKWQARIDRMQKEKDVRQKKRTENIQSRKSEKKKQKMKRAIKRGSYVQV